MDYLASYLRAQLSPDNHAGRPLSEHLVTVHEIGGTLALRIRPVGFNNQEQVFTLANTGRLVPVTEEDLTALRIAEAEAAEAALRDRDAGIAAANEMEKNRAAAAEAEMKKLEAAQVAALAPLDIAAALPDGDPVK